MIDIDPYGVDRDNDGDEEEKRRREDDLLAQSLNLGNTGDTDSWLGNMADQKRADIAADTTPDPVAAAQSYGDALEKRRADAMSAYEQAAAKKPSDNRLGEKVGNWFGDNAVGILGTLLDAGLNKGRNIPAILTQNAQAQAQSEAIRRGKEDRAMDFQLRAQQQRAATKKAEQESAYQSALQRHWAEQQAAAERGLGIRQQGLDIRANKAGIETDPNHPSVIALKQQIAANTPDPEATLKALADQNLMTMRQNPAYKGSVDLFFKAQGIPLAAQQAAQTAAAGTQAKIGVETRPENVAAQAAAAEAQSAAQARGAQTGQQAGKLASGTIMSLEDLEPELNDLGITVANPGLMQSALSSPQHAPKLIVQARGYARARKAIELADEEKRKFVEAVKKGDMTAAANARATYNNHKDEYAGAMMDLTDVHSQSAQHEFKNQVPSIMNPVLTLDTVYNQIEAGAESGLGVYGMRSVRPDLATPLVGGGGGHAPAARPARAARPRPKAAAPAAPGKYKGYTATRNADGTYTVTIGTRSKVAPAAWVESEFKQLGGAIQ